MAQPLIKFFRVEKTADLQATQKVQGGLYFETSTGILYVYNGTAFEAYSGLKSATYANQKLVLTPSVGTALEIDLSNYVDSTEFNTELLNYVKKEQTIAGIDLRDNITVEELKTALGLTAANLAGEANVIEGVKVNGAALTVGTDKKVDILVTEGTNKGTIAVNGVDVTVKGLDAGAYLTEKKIAELAADSDTTYTFAQGSKLGEFTVTPKGGTAQTVTIAGLGTAAGKAAADFVANDATYAANMLKLSGIEEGADKNYISSVGDNLAVDADGKLTVTLPEISEATVKGIAEGEKVLSLENALLSTTISLSYDSTAGTDGKKYIRLTGKGGADLGKIDATAFIKDGMLESGELSWCKIVDGVHTPVAEGTEGAVHCLKLILNTDGGSEEIHIPLGELVDVYTGKAGEVVVDGNNVIGLADKTVSATTGTALTPAHGGLFNVVTNVTYDAKGRLSGVETSKVTLPTCAAIGNGDVTGSDDYVSVEVKSAAGVVSEVVVNTDNLATKITTIESEIAENEIVTAAALVNLNDRLAALPTEVGVLSVTKGTDGEFLATSIAGTAANPTVAVSATVVKSASQANTGLATDGYVKEQIAAIPAHQDKVTDVQVAGVSAIAAGETVAKLGAAAGKAVADKIAENGEGLVTAGQVYNALCWASF